MAELATMAETAAPSAEKPMPPTPTMEGSDPELREVAKAMVMQAGSIEHVLGVDAAYRSMLAVQRSMADMPIQEHETPKAHPPVLE